MCWRWSLLSILSKGDVAQRTLSWKSVAPSRPALHAETAGVLFFFIHTFDLPGGSEGKESACNAGDPGLIPGLGRSHPFLALSHLAHHGLAAQGEQAFIFPRFTLCTLTTPLPATRVAPLQLPAPLISMVTEDMAIIRSSGICFRELVCTGRHSWSSLSFYN